MGSNPLAALWRVTSAGSRDWSHVMSTEIPWSLIMFGLTAMVGGIVLISMLTRKN